MRVPALSAGLTRTRNTKLVHTPFGALRLEMDTNGPKAIVLYADGHPDYPLAGDIYQEGTVVNQHELVAGQSMLLKNMVKHGYVTYPAGTYETKLRQDLVTALDATKQNAFTAIAQNGVFTRTYQKKAPQKAVLRIELPTIESQPMASSEAVD